MEPKPGPVFHPPSSLQMSTSRWEGASPRNLSCEYCLQDWMLLKSWLGWAHPLGLPGLCVVQQRLRQGHHCPFRAALTNSGEVGGSCVRGLPPTVNPTACGPQVTMLPRPQNTELTRVCVHRLIAKRDPVLTPSLPRPRPPGAIGPRTAGCLGTAPAWPSPLPRAGLTGRHGRQG